MPGLSQAALSLIEARRAAGLSQAALARRIGISPASLSLLLRGAYPARNLDSMERRILAALGKIQCPYLGRSIAATDCLAARGRPVPTSDPKAMRFWRQCQTCAMGRALKGG